MKKQWRGCIRGDKMVMGLLAKLLMTKQLRFEKGQIELRDIHLTLVPSFFIGELTQYFLKENRLRQLYLISWLWGFRLVGQVVRDFNLNTPAKVYNWGMELAEAMGIGIYKTCDYEPGRYTHFIISLNPYTEYLKGLKTGMPVDHFIAGCMGGGGCHVHGQLCQNIELKCQTKGDAHCEFLTGTEDELKSRGLWDITQERYQLDEILPMQKRYYDAFFKNEDEGLTSKIIGEALKL
ncbi:hypothetical protein GF319_03255 [Candidatus Bathyarchaeota archaeon]|nr:hypothetical protein [Candidatus Bathyarchaeota archaeon]